MPSKRSLDAAADGDPAAGALAPVARRHPIRVLVVSTDPAYHERARMVLAELGRVISAMTSLAEPGAIARLAVQERAAVVLLDATDCERAAHDVIAALAEAAPRAGIVNVCHHCTDAARALGALPKWGWTQDLRAAVEDACRRGNPRSALSLRSMRRRPRCKRTPGPQPRP